MTSFRHPHIEPPLVIEVADDRVEAHIAAGWLPHGEQSTHDPEPTGEDHEPTEENA